MVTKAEQSEATRAKLLAAARDLFAEQGYAATSTTEIVRAAGVTRGALYHQFEDKAALFLAVYEAVEEELTAQFVELLAGAGDPLEALRRGAEAFLDVCLDPAVRRITLIDGPAVLGYERWREVQQRYGLGLIVVGLRLAMEARAVPGAPVEPLAHFLLGGLVETGLAVAHAEHPEAAREEAGRAITALLEGLRAAAQPPGERRHGR